MVEYLQSSVGILHKNHAASITNFIKHTVDAELSPKEDCPRLKKRLTFCVEGNISVGKSTFLQKIASETIELRDLVEVYWFFYSGFILLCMRFDHEEKPADLYPK